MEMQFTVSIVLTSTGAFIVWMVGIARKDPPLYRELRRFVRFTVLTADLLFVSLAAILIWTDWLPVALKKPVKDLIPLVTTNAAMFVCSLPMLTRISELPPLTEAPPTQSKTQSEPPVPTETKPTSSQTTSDEKRSS